MQRRGALGKRRVGGIFGGLFLDLNLEEGLEKKWQDAGCPQIITPQNYLRPKIISPDTSTARKACPFVSIPSSQWGERVGLWNVRNSDKKRRLNKVQSENVLSANNKIQRQMSKWVLPILLTPFSPAPLPGHNCLLTYRKWTKETPSAWSCTWWYWYQDDTYIWLMYFYDNLQFQ